MKTVCTIVLCLAASLQLSTASAQVYQWKDASGRTIISDTPPPASIKGGRTISTTPSPSASGSPPQSMAERDMEFKKRRQEASQKGEEAAKEQAAAAERRENCERAKGQLASLESGQRLVTHDENGERRYLDDDQRQREIAQTRKAMAESCK